MDVNVIIWSIVVLGALGAGFGIMLAGASKKFAVKTDPTVAQIRENLPGANCGGCGFPGCDGFASALAKREADIHGCAVMGVENLRAISAIMGIEAVEVKPRAARVMCLGKEGCRDKFVYEGAMDCRAAKALAGGHRACKYACIGLGTCAKTCKFDAITMGEHGIAAIDTMKCTGCGACVEACPQESIQVLDLDIDLYVCCKNPEKGKAVTSVCTEGCISCGKCARVCPFGAIEMVDDIPVIDYSKCRECRTCLDECPRHSIVRTKPIRRAKILADACIGCSLCKKACPFGAITGELKSPHVVHDNCRGCGICFEKCRKDAIVLEDLPEDWQEEYYGEDMIEELQQRPLEDINQDETQGDAAEKVGQDDEK